MREVYRAFATPAVFDPITVLSRHDPSELVYVWDRRMDASTQFQHDRSYARGRERENYAQPGYWYNGGGQTEYWTDAMGQPVDAMAPAARRQVISRSNSVGAPAPENGQVQFKMRVNYCDGTFPRTHQGGDVRPRVGIAGRVDRSKLGLKN